MRCSSQTLLYITLAAALSSNAFAQRGFAGGQSRGGQYRGDSATAAPAGFPSSTALGAGASLGRPGFPSSTAMGAGAPPRSALGGSFGGGYNRGGYYANGSSGRYGGGRSRGGSRDGYGRGGRHGDYADLPFSYFLAPYYYPSLDYGSAPYGGAPEDMPYDPSADSALVTQNLLGEQVQRLSAELAQLKYAQQPPPATQTPAPAEPSAPVIPVTVVLRNGQKLQVQNYAVMDHTFWDFSKQPARKIPISSIDVPASSEATAASGGEFPQLTSKP